ncbi:DUF6483 family protein [Clostridium sp.]
MEKNKSDQIYKIALDFYEVLSEKRNEELLEGNFLKRRNFSRIKRYRSYF